MHHLYVILSDEYKFVFYTLVFKKSGVTLEVISKVGSLD